MVDKEKQVIAFIDAKKKTPNFEVAVVSRFGEVGEYYLQLIQKEARFQKLKAEIDHHQSLYDHLSDEEREVVAFIDAHKNMLYFEEVVIEAFGELGAHCLNLIETNPKLRHLRDEIHTEKRRFAALQQEHNPSENHR